MQVLKLHDWNISIRQAIELQERLRSTVSWQNRISATPKFIAGVDMSVNRAKEMACSIAVVLSYPGLEVVEIKTAQGRLEFPYVPGLLSFRELPITLTACEQLTNIPDLVIADAHGVAHPRRMGFASHLGLFLDTPTIGCAKSLLCGSFDTPGDERGCSANILDNGEVIGAAVRTRQGVKPVFVSVGHMVDLPSAIRWVLKCSRGYRLPEPTRIAHITSHNGSCAAVAANI